MRERLELLDANEHGQIFGIIKKYTDTFTKTQTGVLVSSDVLSDECIAEIEKMIDFYIDQHKMMEADAVERKTYERR